MSTPVTAASRPDGAGGDGNARPVLEIRNLTKYFPVGGLFSSSRVHALEDASVALYPGEIVSLVGESGSGKSTTARLIARLMPPTGGQILFQGQDVLASEPHAASLHYRSKVQMIFQDPFGSLNPVKTIGHHLARPLCIHHPDLSPQAVGERVHDLLTTVGLNPAAEFAAKFPHQLSGGQRQRVAIARALAAGPEVILADEPISMLDVSIRMGVLNLIERLKEEQGIAYLYITHDIASARYIGDRAIVMYAGYMVEGGEGERLIAEPAHPYTRLLLSAVPDPGAPGERRRLAAHGEICCLVDPPPGCRFAARCPDAMDVCRQVMPAVTGLGAGHWIRCHLYPSGK